MTPADLQRWFNDGFYDVAESASPHDPDKWWPSQAEATAWCWAAFLRAFLESFHGYRGHVDFGAELGKAHTHLAKQHVLDKLWRPNDHTDGETLVDLTIHDWDSSAPLLLAAESEMSPTQGVENSLDGNDGYSWDFYKLLLVRCRLRLFFACVGPADGTRGSVRRDRLMASLGSLLKGYSRLVDDGDEIGIVLLPMEWADDPLEGWRDARFAVWNGREIDAERLWARGGQEP